ncbi:MAG TPA: hypothetical protein VHW09_22695 [Bryobacteraceae bacterium]|jgi:hypothetical protein|nr:hypothetical protein [Bryobacteraceae bacterium]
MKEFGWFAVIAGAVILEAVTAPGTGLSGRGWKLSHAGDAGMVRLTLERSRPGNRMVTSNDVSLKNFQGFTPEMLNHSGPAKFQYVQDAATLECEGKFGWGRGSGSFTVTPNPQFAAELVRLGFAPPNQDDLYQFVITGTTLDFIREVRGAGIVATLQDVLDLSAHGVTSQYIHDVARTGYRDLKADDLIALHDHGVEAHFLEKLKDAGYQLDSGQVIQLKDHGVDSSFIGDLAANGLQPDSADLVAMRDHGVTADYLRAVRDAGDGAFRADETITMRDHGVSREFVLETHDLGYRFTPNELVELHDHGVDEKYLRTIHDSGMRNLNADQLVQLHDHGVE